MATTISVFSLGTSTVWVQAQDNSLLSTSAVEDALRTYGSVTEPLWGSQMTWQPAGTESDSFDTIDPCWSTRPDIDNNCANDQFSVDGGITMQRFDASMTFDATIIHRNGATSKTSAVIVQDTEGRMYWVPEIDESGNQDDIKSANIVSIELTDPVWANGRVGAGYNLAVDRVDSEPVCFVEGTKITTSKGGVPVEELRVGSLVRTMDHGSQPVRWVGRREVSTAELFLNPRLRPIKILAGELAPNVPSQDLYVSQQLRLLVNSPVAQRMFNSPEALIPAGKLTSAPGIALKMTNARVTYYHILFDRHEIVFSNDTPTESFYTGPQALLALAPTARKEIMSLFPQLRSDSQALPPARLVISQRRQIEDLISRLAQTSKTLIEP